MKKLFTKLAACLLSAAVLAQSLPVLAGISDNRGNTPDIVAKWVLEPTGAKRLIPGNGVISANPDGSRNVPAADNFCVLGMKAALPAGTYFMKYWINITRGSDTGRIDENDRPVFMATGGGDVAVNDLSAFPDGEWKQVVARFVVPQKSANVMKDYSIKGPMPFIVGGENAVCKIGREIVISTNSSPLADQETVLAYVTGKGGNTVCGGKENADSSVTSVKNNEQLVKFKAELPEGTYYLKLTSKIAADPARDEADAPAAQLLRDDGDSWDLPSLSEYVDGVWKNNCVRFTSDGKEHEYVISAADSFTVAKDFIISKNDTALDAAQNDIVDCVYNASDIAQSLGCKFNTNWQAAYSSDSDSLDLTSKLGTDRLVWGISPLVSVNPFVSSGSIPKGKFYVKVLAKVPQTASSGAQNSALFAIEKDYGITAKQQIENVNFGEFTKADEYQTIVREFDASSTSSGGSVSIDLRYFGNSNLSDLSVKKIVISTNPEPIDDSQSVATDISWPDNQLLPSFGTPASTLIAVNMSTGDASVQDIVTARAVQGIVNRTRPRVTILESIEGNTVDPYAWEDTMGLKYKNIPGNSARQRLVNLIEMFKDEIDGYIKYETTQENIQSLNVATTVSGIKNAIPLDVSQADSIAPSLGLQMVDDLTGKGWAMDSAGRISAAEYLYTNYKGQYNDRVILNINPGTDGTAGEQNNLNLRSGNTRVRDLAVAMKIPVIWLDAKVSKELTEVDKFYDDMNAAHPSTENGICPVALGFFPTESEGVRETSKKGITCVPSDNFANYTVYSALSREIDPPPVPKKPELENYNYVSIVSSDGDNICTSEGATRKGDMWDSRRRGQAKIGWTISPALLDAAPQMLQYYLGGATQNDTFVSGPSGLGYTQAANKNFLSTTKFWPSTTWAANYGAWSNRYFEKTSLSSITVWLTITSDLKNAFLSKFPSLQGYYLQYAENNSTANGSEVFTGNVPSKTFNSYNYVDNINDAGKVTDAIKALKPTSSPKFYAYQEQTFAVRYDTMNDQQKAAEKENSSVKFVRSDHFFMLMNEANGKPINNALQAKTFASGSDDGFDCGKAVDGSFGRTHGWQSSAAGEKWLAVDLGKRLKISRYILKNAETASYPANTNTKAYTLQGSNDKRTWEDIDSVADNTSAIIYKDVACDKNYRFVRVNVTDPGADGVARIQDIELYAVNKSTPDDTELRAEINTSSAITQQGNYTFSSWKAFTDAKKAAEEFSSAAGATQVQIDDLTFALRDAREALSELKSDNLLSALSDAEKVEPQPELKPIYSKASWEAYQTALAKALEIKERLSEVPVTLEQKEVNAVQLALKSAIEGLSADNSELVKVLSEVPSEDKQDNFTAASWKAYQAALAKANDVIAAADKQYMFDEALSELKNALGDMVDIVNLKKAIAAAEAVNLPDYTAASRLTLSDALKTAKTALESDSLSQQDADSAAQTLNLAVESLLLSVKSVTVVSSTALTLKVGMTSGVNAVVSPAEAADKSLVFVSSNAKIASVDQTGKIKAISPGSAVVTVRSSESSVSAAVKVTVNPKAPAKPKIKKSGKKVTVKIKKVKGTTGTEVSVYKGRKRVKRLKTAKSTCKFKLKKGRYTFKLKSYKKTGGKLYYSAFSKAAKFKVK